MKRLVLPYSNNLLESVRAGDDVELSGVLFVGRDQVHKRLFDALSLSEEVPFPFEGNGIYYMGPSPAPEGFPIGAAGPTTSARMDPFSPSLIRAGLKLMIGKGPRSEEVRKAIEECHGLYLQAYGGCGALYASCIKSAETVAYPELGPEALLKLTIERFPAICVIDSTGRVFKGGD